MPKPLQTKATEFLFAPGVEEIYPPAQAKRTSVHVQEITAKYCGENRPGHFTGVTTVVSKLFNIVQPDVAVFGQKDFQQLLTIEHMVADMRYPIEVLGAPTMREANGLAMSSRNGFLTPEQKAHAGLLQQTLQHCAAQLKAGNKNFAKLEQLALQTLCDEGFRPDYFQIASRFDLQPASADDQRLVILAAAFLGKPRLIDNLQGICRTQAVLAQLLNLKALRSLPANHKSPQPSCDSLTH